MNTPPVPPAPSSSAKPAISLRTRLVLSSILITFLAMAGMGYYVYFQAQQSSSFLSRQLDQSTRKQAQAQLIAAASEHAALLNDFFASIKKDTLNLSASTSQLLSQEPALSNSPYWNALQYLARLPSGSWDNPNSEPGSVFIPARIELADSLAFELNALKQLDFIAPALLASNPDVVAVYFGGMAGETLYYPNIDLAAIVPPDFDVTRRPWFVKAAPPQNPEHRVVWSDPYLDAALHGIVVTSSAPVYEREAFRGVAAMDIQLTRITDLVSRIRVGESGYAFLVDKDRRLIAMPDIGYQAFGASPEAIPLGEVLDQAKLSSPLPAEFWNALNGTTDPNRVETFTIRGQEYFAIFRSIPEVAYSLVVLVPSREMLATSIAAMQQVEQSSRNTLLVSLLLVSVILLASLLAALGISNRLTSPLRALTHTAEEITRGNLQTQIPISGADEIGILAKALDTMTSTLRELIQSLEQRVEERTAALKRRSLHFKIAGEVGSVAAAQRDLNTLLNQSARLLSERFGFYHVGIFLLDSANEFAVLQAANSPGGQRLLARGHRLKVGEVGIVGHVAASAQPRIALDVGADAVYFDNPDLPETRSEMALPLRAAGRVLGVLDIQSAEPQAFTEEDIEVLQLVADQLAIAIENARLLEQLRASLQEMEKAYREFTREGWKGFAPGGVPLAGYRFDSLRLEPIRELPKEAKIALEKGIKVMGQASGDAAEGSSSAAIPIRLRGETIGVINVRFQRQHSPESILAMIEQISERLATAVENARLLEETRQRAERDALISETTSRLRSTLDLESVLRLAAQELQRAFRLKEAEVRLGVPTLPSTDEAPTPPPGRGDGRQRQ